MEQINNSLLLREIYEKYTLVAVKSANQCINEIKGYMKNHTPYVYPDSYRQYNEYEVIIDTNGISVIGHYNLDLVEFISNRFQKHKSQLPYSKNKKAKKVLLRYECDLSEIFSHRKRVVQFSADYIYDWVVKILTEAVEEMYEKHKTPTEYRATPLGYGTYIYAKNQEEQKEKERQKEWLKKKEITEQYNDAVERDKPKENPNETGNLLIIGMLAIIVIGISVMLFV